MGNLNHTQRAYLRKADKQINKSRNILQQFVEGFLKDCFRKNEQEIKEIYKKYESMWVENAIQHNVRHLNVMVADKNKNWTLLEDAFEDSVMNGHKSVKNLKDSLNGKESTPEQKFQYKEAVRTFDIFKRRSKFQKFLHTLSKHFFVKGTYTKYKTGNTPESNLSLVK